MDDHKEIKEIILRIAKGENVGAEDILRVANHVLFCDKCREYQKSLSNLN